MADKVIMFADQGRGAVELADCERATRRAALCRCWIWTKLTHGVMRIVVLKESVCFTNCNHNMKVIASLCDDSWWSLLLIHNAEEVAYG